MEIVTHIHLSQLFTNIFLFIQKYSTFMSISVSQFTAWNTHA